MARARLSPREREVAALVAQGRSNREIGAALVIATRTIDTHVGHIPTKLNLRTRAQMVVLVTEHDSPTGPLEPSPPHAQHPHKHRRAWTCVPC
jgi:DNA-binding NarL/FixJ family response regulator